jgi:hypothetical protein
VTPVNIRSGGLKKGVLMGESVPDSQVSPSQASVFEQEDAPKCIYHYTSASGLKGIIEENKLWATDVWY